MPWLNRRVGYKTLSMSEREESGSATDFIAMPPPHAFAQQDTVALNDNLEDGTAGSPCEDSNNYPPGSPLWSFADTNKTRLLSRDGSPHATDEVFNSVSHLSAAMISLLGMVLLIAQSGGNAWKIVSFSVYGSSLINLFICSTLHHSISSTPEVSCPSSHNDVRLLLIRAK